jgi:hypothetical protein
MRTGDSKTNNEKRRNAASSRLFHLPPLALPSLPGGGRGEGGGVWVESRRERVKRPMVCILQGTVKAAIRPLGGHGGV